MTTLRHHFAVLASTLALGACAVTSASSGERSAPDAGDVGGDDAGALTACPARSGDFVCGAGACSRGIQACIGGLCEWYGELGAPCGACPTCDCLRASSLNVSSCHDDGHGGITYAIYAGVEGDPCKSDANCANAVCQGGACHCLPAGASLPSNGTNACCSGWAQAGVCTAQPGSPCTTRAPDCNGGTCNASTCSCVGAGGYCNVDTDCCAGATHCAQGQCQ